MGDSTSEVARALIPFIPATSKYWIMNERSKEESRKLAEKRADHPHEYNETETFQPVMQHGLSMSTSPRDKTGGAQGVVHACSKGTVTMCKSPEGE